MKPTSKIIAVFAIAGGLVLGASRATAQVSVAVGVQINAPTDFYTPLAPEGAWVDVGSYGRCWHPAGVAADWRPYCDGTWVWTDCGWYWQSDEPFAWACYHYGSWVDDPSVGWVWIPGTEWAPAWVTWRMGGDHIGWAPCGPGGATPEAGLFVFVDSHHFNDHIRRSDVVINNTTFINQTRVYGGPRTETRNIGSTSQRIAVNEGPGVDAVEKATGQKFTPRPVQEVDRQTQSRAPETLRSPRNETPERETAPAVKSEPKAAPPANRENVRTPDNQQSERRPEKLPPGDAVPERNVEPPHESPPSEGGQNMHRAQPETPPTGTTPATRPVEPQHPTAPPDRSPDVRRQQPQSPPASPAPTAHPSAPPEAHPAPPPEKGHEEQKGGERPAPDKDKDKNQ